MSYFYYYSFPLPILNIMSHYPYANMQIITQLIFLNGDFSAVGYVSELNCCTQEDTKN